MEGSTSQEAYLAKLVGKAFGNSGSQQALYERAKGLGQWIVLPNCKEAVDWDETALRELALTGAAAKADTGCDWAAEAGQRLTVYTPERGLQGVDSIESAVLLTKGSDSWAWIHVADPTIKECIALCHLLGDTLAVGALSREEEEEEAEGGCLARAVIRGRVIGSVDYGSRSLVRSVVRRLPREACLGSAVEALAGALAEAEALGLRAVEAEVAAIERLAMARGSAELLGRIGRARRAVLRAWRGLAPSSELHVVCAHCEAALGRAHALCAAHLAVKQAGAAVRLAEVSSRWLLLVAVLLPLQYATGLFGMNISVPWILSKEARANDNVRAWFGVLIGLAIAFAVAIYIARKKRLI
ncbi:hypothetical protein GGI20_005034 [Coemansia sp. BCRC 34301]|nr:hypothetical protein GGI20_005034 [Coemansia sp. BCRC 34301]